MASAVTTTPLSGVHCVALPTPFAIGDVNAYLLEGEPLTLIDCGPNSGHALLALERSLALLGYTLSDLQLLLITHQHADHLGLAEILVDCSGANVGCLAALAPYARDFDAASARDDDLGAELMLAHGVDRRTVRTLREFTRIIRGFGGSFETTVPLEPDDVVEAGGRRLRVVHRPGHSPSDTLFLDEEHGVAFGGDHLLARTSSNALITHPLDGAAGTSSRNRPHALATYIESMKATRALGLAAVLPGHGDVVADPQDLIDRRLAFHEDRGKRVLAIVAEGWRSAHEVATEIWGDVATSQAYLTTCEVIGHLELLADRGLVEEDESAAVTRFRAVEGAA